MSKYTDARLLLEGNNIQRRTNTALLLEEIKQEVDSVNTDGLDKVLSLSRRRGIC